MTTGLLDAESGHRAKHSAATPQAARHRINSLEASTDSAAARAQTVWARPQTSLPTSRTRWRRPACISPRPIAHAASDRVGLERQRSKARGPRFSTRPRRCPRVLCIVWLCHDRGIGFPCVWFGSCRSFEDEEPNHQRWRNRTHKNSRPRRRGPVHSCKSRGRPIRRDDDQNEWICNCQQSK